MRFSVSRLLIIVTSFVLVMAGATSAAADDPESFPGDLPPGYDLAGQPLEGTAAIAATLGGEIKSSKGPDDRSQNMKIMSSRPQTSFTNSDVAFWGDKAYVGNYGGFRVFDISSPANPKLLADVSCPGPQNDVAVWNNLLILSVDAVMAGPNCGDAQLPSVPRPTSGWEGVRVFDVSDPSNPQFVKSVYTDCGSHTHNIIPDDANDRLLVYVLSYALRGGPTCGDTSDPNSPGTPGNGQISIVQVPYADPAAASVLKTVPIPVGQTFDDLVPLGLPATDGCHDVQFFYELGLAAAACLSVGQLWDISDPANPVILEEFDNDSIEIWHSATFTWDGEIVVFGDESVFGSCLDASQLNGRLWFYDTAALQSGGETPLGSFLIPRLQPGEYCSSHLFNVLPRNDRYVLASSWYGGGISVIDFTDPGNAFEVGYYDAQVPTRSSAWAGYWYNGFIYSNDIPRGLDIFNLTDSAKAKTVKFPYLNPQVQENLLP